MCSGRGNESSLSINTTPSIFFSDKMAESMKEELNLKEIDIKEEISIQETIPPSSIVEDTCTVYLQEEILPSSPIEDACTVYLQETILPSSTVEDTYTVYLQEDVGIDTTQIKGKPLRKPIIYSSIMNIYLSQDIFVHTFVLL